MSGLDSKVRKADELYHLISEGDTIGVGLSGGKDSGALLWALAKLRSYCGKRFRLLGLTIDPQFGGRPGNFSELTAFCEGLGVEHIVKPDNLYSVVFEKRQEKNPCSLCARMRRGSLARLAAETGCNKVALGHHLDDVAATFWLNFLYEGRVASFAPVTYLDRSGITVIRPLVLCREREVAAEARRQNVPVIPSGCPVNGSTERARMRERMEQLGALFPDLEQRTFDALQRSNISGYGRTGKD